MAAAEAFLPPSVRYFPTATARSTFLSPLSVEARTRSIYCNCPHQLHPPCLEPSPLSSPTTGKARIASRRKAQSSKKEKNRGVSLSTRASATDGTPSTSSYVPPVFVLNEKPGRKVENGVVLNEKPDRKVPVEQGDDDDDAAITFGPDHKSGYIALIGKPNVGKSTLMNRIVGQKLSIVTHKPQTTRHRILGICSEPGYQMILYDTPGVIANRMHKLDEMMMQNVRTAALNADCVLVIASAADAPQKVVDMLEDGASSILNNRPALLVLNKKDLIKPGELVKKLEWYQEFGGLEEVLSISAKYGNGVSELKDWILGKLPLGPAYYPKDNVSDQPEKFFAAEIVREKIFLQYFKEIPYVCQVNVMKYIERTPPAKDFVEIEIVVEKESQKVIILGKEGSAIKTLATAARLDIEDFTGREVYVEIKVKVKEDWRANESLLKYYGYSGQLVT